MAHPLPLEKIGPYAYGDKLATCQHTICTVRAGVESVTMQGIRLSFSDTQMTQTLFKRLITLSTEQHQHKIQVTRVLTSFFVNESHLRAGR